MTNRRTVWVGYQTPAPDSIQKVEPQEIRVFATAPAAQAWRRELRVTATSPMRSIIEKAVER